MSERSVVLLLDDMREAAARIVKYTGGKDLAGFLADEQCADACVRNLEVIGEAATRLPTGYLAEHPGIDWKGMVGLRNRIVHAYFGIDLEIVWQIILNDLPILRSFLESA